jgi:RAD51-like protein 3
VTEVCGPSGSGRTQVCLSAALTTAERGERVVFFDTANSFSPRRLQQLHRPPPGAPPGAALERALALITVVRPHSIHALLTSLEALSGQIARLHDQRQAPRLVVVDSLSAVASVVLGGQQHTQGTTLVVALAQMLKQMALRYQVAVLVRGGAAQECSLPCIAQLQAPCHLLRVCAVLGRAAEGTAAAACSACR